MIRRLFVTLVALSVTAIAGTGCATFSKNQNAATVNNHELSVNDFERALTELRPLLDPAWYGTDTVVGDPARNILGGWIIGNATLDRLAAEGKSPAPDQIKEVEDSLATQAGPLWTAVSQSTRDFIMPAFVIRALSAADPSLDLSSLGAANISVDSRYGMWSAEASQLLPTR